MFVSTEYAERSDISCSLDAPPNSTAIFCLAISIYPREPKSVRDEPIKAKCNTIGCVNSLV